MSKIFSSKILLGLVVLLLVVSGFFIFSKQEKFTPQGPPVTVGVIQHVKHLDPLYEGFKDGMTTTGYIEGTHVIYDYQFSGGDVQKAAEITRDFIAKDYDLIFAITTPAAIPAIREAAAASPENPIPVLWVADNAIGQVAESYESSGNASVGVEIRNAELTKKKLEFLQKLDPTAKRVGILVSRISPQSTSSFEQAQELAGKLGLTIVEYKVPPIPGPPSTLQIQKIADSIQTGDIDALLTIPDPAVNFQGNPKILADMAKRVNIPTYMLVVQNVRDGALLSYNFDYQVMGVQLAVMAKKIFQGTSPKDIPVEQPEQAEIALNLRTAREIGMSIPNSLLEIIDIRIEE